MPEFKRHIRQVRIDVPLTTSCSYLFVGPDDGNAAPWWFSLYEHVVRLAPDELVWNYDASQDHYVARPELTDRQKGALADFIRGAPEELVAQHRTLRRAVALVEAQVMRLAVVYFAGGDVTNDMSANKSQ